MRTKHGGGLRKLFLYTICSRFKLKFKSPHGRWAHPIDVPNDWGGGPTTTALTSKSNHNLRTGFYIPLAYHVHSLFSAHWASLAVLWFPLTSVIYRPIVLSLPPSQIWYQHRHYTIFLNVFFKKGSLRTKLKNSDKAQHTKCISTCIRWVYTKNKGTNEHDWIK
jgi:hypothetical protein